MNSSHGLHFFRIITLLITTTFFLTACQRNTTPQLGVEYTKLPSSLPNKEAVPVLEVFSLSCANCQNLERDIPQLEKTTHQKFHKLHAIYDTNSQISALIYYAAKMQLPEDPDHQLTLALYKALSMEQGRTLTQQQTEIETLFKHHQLISPYQFDNMQQKLLASILNDAKQLTLMAQVDSVPTLIINGKYKVNIENHESMEKVSKTINYLLKN